MASGLPSPTNPISKIAPLSVLCSSFKVFAVPLLGLSLVLHGLLLMVPMPSRPQPEAEDSATEEEEFVDLLSISPLATPSPAPDASPAPAAPPLPAVAPAVAPAMAPAAVVPPPAPALAPPAPRLPKPSPDPLPTPPPTLPAPQTTVAPEPAETIDQAQASAPPPAVEPIAPAATVPAAEVAELVTRLTRGSGESDFDSTATSFPAVAFLTRRGIQEWSAQQQACFFSQISADSYQLAPGAVDVRYLTRNVQFIEQQDVPRTFPAPAYQVVPLPEGYCGHTLFQVLQGEQPLLFISVVGLGVGNPPATGLVVIWSSDPRQG